MALLVWSMFEKKSHLSPDLLGMIDVRRSVGVVGLSITLMCTYMVLPFLLFARYISMGVAADCKDLCQGVVLVNSAGLKANNGCATPTCKPCARGFAD